MSAKKYTQNMHSSANTVHPIYAHQCFDAIKMRSWYQRRFNPWHSI